MLRRAMLALDPPPRDASACASARRMLLLALTFRCAADGLWSPLHALAHSLLLPELLLLALYLLFLALYLPFSLLALMLTSYGAAVVYAVGLFLLGKFITRIIAFPGSLASVQRDIAKDYIRRLCAQLAHLANSILDWTEMLQAVLARTSLGFDESVQRQYADLVFMNTQTLPTLFRWIGEAKDRVQAELKEPELDQIDQLRSAIQNLMHALTPALPEIGEFLTSSGRFGAKDSVQQRVQARLSSLTTACEGLQACLLAIKPDGQGDMGLQAVVETVKTMGSGPRGIEKLAFHMMRHQITELYGGELVTIRGHDGNVIDGCYVPCTLTRRYMMAQRNAVPSTAAPAATQNAPKSVGTVLFCNPNAGFWECSGQGSAISTWLGYYVDAGFDVFMFNYRGYNASEGVPNPMRLKADGEAVLDYLRTERRAEKVLIHGESIGGMIACHIASVCTPPPAMLVADRTFASLEATAARLVGTWAYYAVQWLTMWVTDVVTDFLTAECPKIVLCDPNDEVIANGASLKTGIAARVVFGDQAGLIKQMSQRYIIAAALQQAPPHDDPESLLAEANNLERPLSEAFVEHLCACLIYIAREARHIEHHFVETTDEEGLELPSVGDSDSDGPSEGEAEQHDHSHGCCEHRQHQHHHVMDGTGENIVLASRDRVVRGRLERLCAQSVDDPRLKPMEKVWLAIARINGNCGMLLIQSLSRSLETFRAWLCETIVWSGSTREDEAIPAGAVAFVQGLADLRRIVGANPDLALSPPVHFTLEAFECIAKRMQSGISSPTSALRISRKRLGTLIPLHCGHNGPLSVHQKTVFSELLMEAGFPLCTSVLVTQHELKLPGREAEHKVDL